MYNGWMDSQLALPMVYQIDGITPVIDPTAFVHPTAVLIGDVIVGPGAYVGPLASLRGDMGRIELKAGSNVQDHCVAHSFPGKDVLVEIDGHIGHAAVLHGCLIGENALIGMNSVIMDDVQIGPNCIVGANAFVRAGTVFEANQLIVGSPARILRTLTDQEKDWKRQGTAEYHQLVHRCKQSLRPVIPLEQVESDRPRFQADHLKPLNQIRNSSS